MRKVTVNFNFEQSSTTERTVKSINLNLGEIIGKLMGFGKWQISITSLLISGLYLGNVDIQIYQKASPEQEKESHDKRSESLKWRETINCNFSKIFCRKWHVEIGPFTYLRILKWKVHPNESWFSWYSIAIKDCMRWRETRNYNFRQWMAHSLFVSIFDNLLQKVTHKPWKLDL